VIVPMRHTHPRPTLAGTAPKEPANEHAGRDFRSRTRTGRQLMSFDEAKRRQAAAYSSAPFEQLADSAADIHDRLVDAVGVKEGERWLDIATGTGAVAIRASRRGARVTGQDLADGLVARARRFAAAEGLDTVFDVGDCEELPYADAEFDVVTSAHGAVFAPDHRAVAAELARVSRPGGRLGLTAWRPGGAIATFFAVLRPFQPPPPEGAGNPLDWGRADYVAELLGERFELTFVEAESPQLAWSSEALWTLFTTAFGPVKALAASLDEVRREQLHQNFVDFYERYRVPGGISSPREYLLITGRRRP
jgi:SAM-dependent methyltransferase